MMVVATIRAATATRRTGDIVTDDIFLLLVAAVVFIFFREDFTVTQVLVWIMLYACTNIVLKLLTIGVR